MAHTCPECGLRCHCNGDIDDCEFDDTPEQHSCLHCDPWDDEDRDDEDDWFSDDEWPGGEGDWA